MRWPFRRGAGPAGVPGAASAGAPAGPSQPAAAAVAAAAARRREWAGLPPLRPTVAARAPLTSPLAEFVDGVSARRAMVHPDPMRSTTRSGPSGQVGGLVTVAPQTAAEPADRGGPGGPAAGDAAVLSSVPAPARRPPAATTPGSGSAGTGPLTRVSGENAAGFEPGGAGGWAWAAGPADGAGGPLPAAAGSRLVGDPLAGDRLAGDPLAGDPVAPADRGPVAGDGPAAGRAGRRTGGARRPGSGLGLGAPLSHPDGGQPDAGDPGAGQPAAGPGRFSATGPDGDDDAGPPGPPGSGGLPPGSGGLPPGSGGLPAGSGGPSPGPPPGRFPGGLQAPIEVRHRAYRPAPGAVPASGPASESPDPAPEPAPQRLPRGAAAEPVPGPDLPPDQHHQPDRPRDERISGSAVDPLAGSATGGRDHGGPDGGPAGTSGGGPVLPVFRPATGGSERLRVHRSPGRFAAGVAEILASSGMTGSGMTGSGMTGSGMTGSGMTGSGVAGSGVAGSGPHRSGDAGTGPDGGERTESAPAELRATLSRMLGADVGDPPVHRSAAASRTAAGLGARAYTRDGEVFLPAEAGPLDAPAARGLLAHELTHAAQQRLLPTLPAEDSEHGRRLETQAGQAEAYVRGDAGTPAPGPLVHPGAAQDRGAVPPGTAAAGLIDPDAYARQVADELIASGVAYRDGSGGLAFGPPPGSPAAQAAAEAAAGPATSATGVQRAPAAAGAPPAPQVPAGAPAGWRQQLDAAVSGLGDRMRTGLGNDLPFLSGAGDHASRPGGTGHPDHPGHPGQPGWHDTPRVLGPGSDIGGYDHLDPDSDLARHLAEHHGTGPGGWGNGSGNGSGANGSGANGWAAPGGHAGSGGADAAGSGGFLAELTERAGSGLRSDLGPLAGLLLGSEAERAAGRGGPDGRGETGGPERSEQHLDELATELAPHLDLEDLARRLYPRLRSRLRTELLVDRERAGLLTDFR